MADWDADGPRLGANLHVLLTRIFAAAREKPDASLAEMRRWHREIMHGLSVPTQNYLGRYRGEDGLEHTQVRIGTKLGTAPPQVKRELEVFERTLNAAMTRLDDFIGEGAPETADELAAVIRVCAWAHGEWIRIHPFANGNGRTARLWVNFIAVRFGLPPFLVLRPRPGNAYVKATRHSMGKTMRQPKLSSAIF